MVPASDGGEVVTECASYFSAEKCVVRERKLRTALIAAFTSPETERLSREIGFPIAVISAVVDPLQHAEILSATWHAAWSTAPEKWFAAFDVGYADHRSTTYTHRCFDPRWMGSAPMPAGISIVDGTLSINLPPGCPLSDFAALFGLAMCDRHFDRVARRPAQIRQRFASGRHLDVGARYAHDPSNGSMVLVENLYAFRPKDLPAIAQAAALAMSGLAVTATLTNEIQRERIHE